VSITTSDTVANDTELATITATSNESSISVPSLNVYILVAVYLTSPTSHSILTEINNNGRFYASTMSVESWLPTNITTRASNAYIADYSSHGNIILCDQSESGALTHCNPSNGNITNWQPSSITFYESRAYITADQGGGSNVFLCSIATNNNLNTCTISNGGIDRSTWEAYSITFHNNKAYVADYSGNVYLCPVDQNGNLINCTATNATESGLWHPFAISFVESTALVTSPADGSVFRCSTDPTTGTFTSCNQMYLINYTAPYQIPDFEPTSIFTAGSASSIEFLVGNFNPNSDYGLYLCLYETNSEFGMCYPSSMLGLNISLPTTSLAVY
jgi:hypothetical protein